MERRSPSMFWGKGAATLYQHFFQNMICSIAELPLCRACGHGHERRANGEARKAVWGNKVAEFIGDAWCPLALRPSRTAPIPRPGCIVLCMSRSQREDEMITRALAALSASVGRGYG